MPLIYVKLGIGITEFRDEQLDFELEDPNVPAGAVDYGNMTENFTAALNAGTIIQISEADFFNIQGGLIPATPINITTNYLISLNKYMNVCPLDNSVFFMLQDNKWYKILWSKIKQCVSGAKLNLLFRVGDPAYTNPNYPEDTDTIWTNPIFIGKDYKKLIFTYGSVEIFEERMYDPAVLAPGDIMYYQLDEVAGTVEIPGVAFKNGDILRMLEV